VILPPFVKLGGCRVLNGWIAVGIDTIGADNGTHGNVDAIGLPPEVAPLGSAPIAQADPGDGSLRLIFDVKVLLAILQLNAKLAVIVASATRPNVHPSPDVQVRIETDAIVIHASGTIDAPDPLPGTIPFTADISVRPFVGASDLWVYASMKPNIHADTPFWVDILAGIYDFFGGDAFEKLRKANRGEMPAIFRAKLRQSVPGLPQVDGFIEGRQIVVRPDLVGFWGVGGLHTWWSGPTEDLTPKVTGSLYVRERFLQLAFRHPVYEHDPTLRVLYTLRRPSDGIVLSSGMAWSGSSQPFGDKIDVWDKANANDKFFEVDLVAERPPGTVIATNTHRIAVIDMFDRSHPFARFRKPHYLTGSRGVPFSVIRSAVHRTDMHQRCRFCDAGIRSRWQNYEVEAIDSVPAPEREGFSSRPCPYCFANG
jgi:hypothetical protein